ncbi:unnamed protein product [Prorocentrum cordatum]|uniref:Uncharacterized protein n=2 Tax=Prorocentrum cordatum TaxID=2364126 RepID=A0ABN9QHN8_9DINO|nr:unnamed protein product [Polarella glacialis]
MSAGSHWRSCRRCVPTATRQPPGNRVQPVDPEEAATRTPCFRTGWPRHAMVSGPDPSKARPLQLRPPPAPGRGGAAPRAQRGARRRSAATQRSSDDACEAAKRRSGKAAKRRSRAAAQRRSGEAAKRRRRRSGKAAASGDDEATTETAPRRSDEAAARQRRRRRPRARALAASPTERCFLLGGKPWPSRSGVSATDCSMSSPRLRSASSTPTGTGACAPPPSPAASGARPEGLGAPRRGQSRAPGPARGALRRGETTRGRGGASFRPGLPPYRESLGEKSKPCPNPEPRTCPPPAGPHPRWAASEPRARGGSRSGDPSRHERGWATRRRPPGRRLQAMPARAAAQAECPRQARGVAPPRERAHGRAGRRREEGRGNTDRVEARRRRDRRECGRSQNCCESIVCGARVPRPREDRSAPRARFPGAGKRHQLISRPHRSSPPSLPSPKHTTPRAAAGSTKAHSDPRPRWQAAPRPHGTLGGLWRSASAAGRVRSSSAAGAEERARQDGKGGKVRGKLGTRESAARPARSLTRRRKTPPWSACCDVGASSKNRDGNFCRRVRPPRGPYSPPQGPSKRGSGVKEQSAGRGRDPGAPTSRTNWVARGEGKARSRRASLDGPAGQTTLWPKPGSRRAGAPPCRSERRRGPAVARAGWGQDAPRTARRAAAGTEDGHCRGRPAARVCRRRGSLQPGRGQNLQPGRSQNLQPGRGESPQPGRTCRDAPRPGRGGSLRLRQDVLRPGRG